VARLLAHNPALIDAVENWLRCEAELVFFGGAKLRQKKMREREVKGFGWRDGSGLGIGLIG